MTPTPQSPPQIPASPGASFGWAAGWLLVAGLGFFVLTLDFQRVVTFELSGQRSTGFVLFMPFIATVVALLLLVRGIVTVGRTRAYRAQFSPEERARLEAERLRGQPSTPFLVFAAIIGTLWLAGTVIVLVFLGSLVHRPDGLALALMMLGLLALLWIASLRAGLLRRASARALV